MSDQRQPGESDVPANQTPLNTQRRPLPVPAAWRRQTGMTCRPSTTPRSSRIPMPPHRR